MNNYFIGEHYIKYGIGQFVYLVTDKIDVERYIVTGMTLRPNGLVLYALVTAGRGESWHYDFEIQEEPNFT